MVLPDSDRISRVPPYSGSTLERTNFFRLQGFLPALADLSKSLHLTPLFVTPYRVSTNPKRQASWFGLFPFRSPLPGNRFFSSSRYLDVSVPWVCLQDAMYSRQDTTRLNVVGSPFGNLRIKAHLQLPEAYRC